MSEGQCYFCAQVGQISFLELLPCLRTVHLPPSRQAPLLIESTLDPAFLPTIHSNIINQGPFYAAIRCVGGIGEIPAALWGADCISARLSENQAFAFRICVRKLTPLPGRGNEKRLQENVLPALLEKRAECLEKKKILLVEENRVNQLLTRNLLRKWGYNIHVAGNGQEAVQMAGARAYDLILMDLNMPGMDGYAAAGIIRSISLHYSQIPILAFTASAVEQVEAEDVKAVFTAILMKPFNPEMLYNNLHKHLDAALNETGLNPLQAKIDEIARGDEAFKKQLILLYLKSFREILMELNAGKILELDYLRHVRHKHKATFEMLGLSLFARHLLQMQENLSIGHAATESVNAINQLGEQIIQQLESIN